MSDLYPICRYQSPLFGDVPIFHRLDCYKARPRLYHLRTPGAMSSSRSYIVLNELARNERRIAADWSRVAYVSQGHLVVLDFRYMLTILDTLIGTIYCHIFTCCVCFKVQYSFNRSTDGLYITDIRTEQTDRGMDRWTY